MRSPSVILVPTRIWMRSPIPGIPVPPFAEHPQPAVAPYAQQNQIPPRSVALRGSLTAMVHVHMRLLALLLPCCSQHIHWSAPNAAHMQEPPLIRAQTIARTQNQKRL